MDFTKIILHRLSEIKIGGYKIHHQTWRPPRGVMMPLQHCLDGAQILRSFERVEIIGMLS